MTLRRFSDSLQFPTYLLIWRDDSREVNRFSAVSDLASAGKG